MYPYGKRVVTVYLSYMPLFVTSQKGLNGYLIKLGQGDLINFL